MSTKIYYGWRVPLSGLNRFIAKARQQMFAEVVKSVRLAMGAVDPQVADDIKAKYLKSREKDGPLSKEKMARLDTEIRMAIVMRAARDAHFSTMRDPLDFECGITFHIDGDFAYGHGWGNYPYLDALKDIKPAVEYGYWNNTDKPEKVSRKAWDERRDTWDRALKSRHDCLILKAVSFEPSNWEMEQALWDAIYPTKDKAWNLFFGPFILNDPSPQEAVKAALKAMKDRPEIDKKVVRDLVLVLPRIPSR